MDDSEGEICKNLCQGGVGIIETITAAAKMKVLLAAFALLLLGGCLYEISGEQGTQNTPELIQPTETQNPFVADIQHRSDLVNNAVQEAINQQGVQTPIAYKQTCESSIAFIRSERLDTNTNYNTLDTGQKELIQDYRTYLTEAAAVVTACYAGNTPDLSKMNDAKNELY